MSPKTAKIMIIRHAEKPDGSGSLQGVLDTGKPDSESLIVQGWQRAGALACLFAPTRNLFQNSHLAQPKFLYASGIGTHSKSMRPQQTITPLSKKLGLDINTSYLKGQELDLVESVLACNGVVLICWEHHNIPTIAEQITNNATAFPREWPDSCFDVVWIFDLDSTSDTYSFKQVTQCLLAEDSSTPIH